jgi:hypothetical protein
MRVRFPPGTLFGAPSVSPLWIIVRKVGKGGNMWKELAESALTTQNRIGRRGVKCPAEKRPVRIRSNLMSRGEADLNSDKSIGITEVSSVKGPWRPKAQGGNPWEPESGRLVTPFQPVCRPHAARLPKACKSHCSRFVLALLMRRML